MKRKRIAGVCITLAAVVLAGTFAVSGNNTKDKNHVEIINVSYDPTREFYEAYNPLFEKYYKEKTGKEVNIFNPTEVPVHRRVPLWKDAMLMSLHWHWSMISH